MPEKQQPQQPNKTDLMPSQRFTDAVIRLYSTGVGELALNDYQRELVQHYFIKADAVLKQAERDRKQDNDLAYSWANINMEALALDVVHHAKLGLDPTMKNHLHLIPYKNSKVKKYDLTFMVGYEGKQYLALEMALERPASISCGLVYSNDKFMPKMKSPKNLIESYEFEIPNPFDRGDVVGGYGYIAYDNPEKNKLIIMSRKDIDKRRQSAQSDKFWGRSGADGKVTSGWYEEMALKTIIRHVCDQVPKDPRKANASLLYVEQRQEELEAEKIVNDIEDHANTGPVVDVPAEAQQEPQPGPEGQQTIPGAVVPDWAGGAK